MKRFSQIFNMAASEVPFCPNHCLYLNLLKKNQVKSHLVDLRTEMQVMFFSRHFNQMCVSSSWLILELLVANPYYAGTFSCTLIIIIILVLFSCIAMYSFDICKPWLSGLVVSQNYWNQWHMIIGVGTDTYVFYQSILEKKTYESQIWSLCVAKRCNIMKSLLHDVASRYHCKMM